MYVSKSIAACLALILLLSLSPVNGFSYNSSDETSISLRSHRGYRGGYKGNRYHAYSGNYSYRNWNNYGNRYGSWYGRNGYGSGYGRSGYNRWTRWNNYAHSYPYYNNYSNGYFYYPNYNFPSYESYPYSYYGEEYAPYNYYDELKLPNNETSDEPPTIYETPSYGVNPTE